MFNVPEHLWSESTIKMPEELITDYRNELQSLKKYDEACGESPKGIIGGILPDECENHFTHRFAASSIRTEYLLLDPEKKLRLISTDLHETFSCGKVAILDVPCGAGAGLFGFLALLADLRKHNLLPKLPLDLKITAGDYASRSRELYRSMMERSSLWLTPQFINVKLEDYHWDATQEPTTAALVDEWFKSTADCEEHVVLVSAFSGTGAENYNDFERSFQHIASRLHNRASTLLWIEPHSNKGVKFLQKIKDTFSKGFSNWFNVRSGSTGKFLWLHPLKKNSLHSDIELVDYRRTIP